MANPNHDSKGRFTSRSGLNKANSTMTQRGKAKVKEHMSDAKAAAIAGGAAVLGAAGAAVLQGISRPIRFKGAQITHHAVAAAEAKTMELLAKHGPSLAGAAKNAVPFIAHHAASIGKAIAAKGSPLKNHVSNMKSASTHSVSGVSSSVKPRVRIPMSSKPKVRVPMGRK